jgi:hypothetical protein
LPNFSALGRLSGPAVFKLQEKLQYPNMALVGSQQERSKQIHFVWDVTPCGLLSAYRRFREGCCLRYQVLPPPPRVTPNATYHNQLHQQQQRRGGSVATSQSKIGLLTLTRQTLRDSNPSAVGSRCGRTDRFVSWAGGPK